MQHSQMIEDSPYISIIHDDMLGEKSSNVTVSADAQLAVLEFRQDQYCRNHKDPSNCAIEVSVAHLCSRCIYNLHIHILCKYSL